MQNGIVLSGEQQLALIEQYGGLEAWGTRDHGAALRGGLGVGGQLPVPVGQAGRLAPRRHAQPDGRELAARRSPSKGGLRSQFTHVIDIGPTILEAAGIPAPTQHRRHRADADARHQLPLQLRRRRRARAPHPAVLRDLRQPRDVQGRLAGVLDAAAHPVGRHAGDDEEVRARRLGPRRRPGRAVLPARRLLPGARPRRRAPREGRRAARAVLGGGREVPRRCRCSAG